MTEKRTYKVLRALDGDRAYAPGDRRQMTEADAAHLVELGSLEGMEGGKRSAPKRSRKAT